MFPSELLNQLPAYFQSQINKIAASINFLQLPIWNEFNNTYVCLHLLEHLLKLNIESVSKPTFQKNYDIVRKKHEERIEQEKNAPIIKKWATILIRIQTQIKSVENKSINASDAVVEINQLVSVTELNSLLSFADEIRTQIGYSIRNLSISCWNKQSDIKSSLSLIAFALQINVCDEAKLKFKQDKTELEELERKYKGVLVCHFCEKNPPVDNFCISKTIYLKPHFYLMIRQYNYMNVKIPRCKKCFKIHTKVNQMKYFIGIAIFILTFTIGTNILEDYFFIWGVLGAAVGWKVSKILENQYLNKCEIKSTSESTLAKHPLLIDKFSDGWTFSKPNG